MPRMDKTKYYIEIARQVSLRSPCSRRKFGAILVKDDAIIATGYTGTVRGTINCGVEIKCLKELHNEPSGSYENCPSCHAEMNVVINAARVGISTIDATLYLAEATGNCREPCYLCKRFLIQAGIKDCYFENIYGIIEHVDISEWIKQENEWIKEKLENGSTT